MKEILCLKNISKKYLDIDVLRSVNLKVMPGEIHGLVGENGAGKSTLLGILFGNAHIANTGGYSGEIYLEGCKITIKTSGAAAEMGIGMVHQEFALIPDMTVAENIKIGRERVIPFTRKYLGENLAYIDRKGNIAEAQAILRRLGLNIDPNQRVMDLSVNFRQFVEVARETGKDDLKVLVLDEPTAVLSKEDAAKLLMVVKEVAARGTGVIFVSHRLEEVMEICDRITVLRDGRVAGAYHKTEFDRAQIISDMIGKTVLETNRKRKPVSGKVVMSFQNFSVKMPGENLKDFNLDVYQGEIIGITGLSGHGKMSIGNGVMGIYPTGGRFFIDDKEIDPAQTAEVIASSVYYLPEDRRQAGLLLERSVMDNVIFTALQRKNSFLTPYFLKSLSFVNRKKARTYTEKCIQALDIKCRGMYQEVSQLSGGNQQKVCLARVLAVKPKVLIVAEPTRGVDIGAKEKILEALIKINEENGTAVILVSSELSELRRVCDRIAVIYDGQLNAILKPEALDIEFAKAFTGEVHGATESVSIEGEGVEV